MFAPDIVLSALNHHLSNQSKQLDINNIPFDISKDDEIIQRFMLFNRISQKQHSEIKIDSKNKWCDMDKKEVENTVCNIINDLNINKSRIKIQPMLLISSNNKQETSPGVFWYCEWNTKAGETQYLWIDDQTGKVMKMKVYIGLSEEQFQKFLPEFNDYCTKYYNTWSVLNSKSAKEELSKDLFDDNVYDITYSSYIRNEYNAQHLQTKLSQNPYNLNITSNCNDYGIKYLSDSSSTDADFNDYGYNYNTITLFGLNKKETYTIYIYIKDGMMYFNAVLMPD